MSAEQKLPDHLASREAYVSELMERVHQGDDDEAQEELDTFALAIDVVREIKVLLSTGGPGDWLTARVDIEHGEYVRSGNVVYHFASWLDYASEELDDDSALVAYFENVISGMPAD